MVFWRKRKTSYEKALEWINNNTVQDEGIIVHTKQPVSYPEVTGYYIPTLYNCGEKDRARNYTKWLISIQHEDGAFPAPDGVPYTFDTAQIMRGLCAAIGDVDGAEESLRKASDWMLTQIEDDGRLVTPSTELWTDIANDLIHTYALPPLAEAGKLLNVPEYQQKAQFVLEYYKQQDALVPFNRLSHFHAYAMEALCEMGELELASQGMAEVEHCQRANGSIPAYPDVDWICSTGIAQYAIVWYTLGRNELAEKAMSYLETIQNKSGGFNGSYGEGSQYIAGAEISWGVKYFLDAYLLRQKATKQ